MGVVGGVAAAAHQATVTTVDQTQIITLQVATSCQLTAVPIISSFIPVTSPSKSSMCRWSRYLWPLNSIPSFDIFCWFYIQLQCVLSSGSKHGGAGCSWLRRAPVGSSACFRHHCGGSAARPLCRHNCHAKRRRPGHLPHPATAGRLSGTQHTSMTGWVSSLVVSGL